MKILIFIILSTIMHEILFERKITMTTDDKNLLDEDVDSDIDNIIEDNIELDIEDIIEEIEDVPIIVPTKKINYLNNKDMLKEIHRSKNSFSEFNHPDYGNYDTIVENLQDIFLPDVQEKAKICRANRLSVTAFDAAVANTSSGKPKLSEFKINPETISVDDLVFRVLTFEHIPLAPNRKKTPKSVADRHVKLNFFPFKHYIIENNAAKEVGRSHYKKGKFDPDSGYITDKLAKMFILLVNKYGQRSNWRNYTFIDEMKGQALLQLSQMSLQFDESKSDNPFSYYTRSLQNSFTRVLLLEKKNQTLRDDLLIESGAIPSFSRQLAFENEIRHIRKDAQDSARDEIE